MTGKTGLSVMFLLGAGMDAEGQIRRFRIYDTELRPTCHTGRQVCTWPLLVALFEQERRHVERHGNLFACTSDVAVNELVTQLDVFSLEHPVQ